MNAKQCLNPNASAQVAAAPFAARPLRGLASRCATRGPERSRVRPSWLRRSFSSRQQRLRVFADPKTHHTLRHKVKIQNSRKTRNTSGYVCEFKRKRRVKGRIMIIHIEQKSQVESSKN